MFTNACTVMVTILEKTGKINNVMNKKKEEQFDLMKNHILEQFANDGEVGFMKGYNGKRLQQERKELINKLIE